MDSLDSLKDIILNTINGKLSPSVLLMQQAMDSAKSNIAGLRYSIDVNTKTIPEKTKITAAIADLEKDKLIKQGELNRFKQELYDENKIIDEQETIVGNLEKAQVSIQKTYIKQLAKSKAYNYNVSDTAPNNGSRNKRVELNKLKEHNEQLQKDIKNLEQSINDIDLKIEEHKKELRIINAQLSPEESLNEAKDKLKSLKDAKAKSQDPEDIQRIEQELQKAETEVQEMQSIVDDKSKVVENQEEYIDPKMLQLRAEYQVMDSGVSVLQYLINNIPVFFTTSSVSIGANGGGPVPLLPSASLVIGNILYGYAFFIMSQVKAASIRFLALAQEIDYKPTTEMSIINTIPVVETSLTSLLSYAPAGSTLV